MIHDEVDKILNETALDAASKKTFESEVRLLKAIPAYEDLSEEELKEIASERCKTTFENTQKQRAFIKPIDPTKNYQQP